MSLLRRVPVHWLLLAPALLFVSAMALFPLVYSFVLGFREWKLARSVTPGDWVGFQNYWYLLTDDPDFLEAMRVTAVFVVSNVSATLLVALGAALLLNKAGRINTFARVLLILPFVMSPALVGISFRFFLNGEYGIVHHLICLLYTSPSPRD